MSAGSSNSNGSRQSGPYHIHDLKYADRVKLCNLLDVQDRWRELGGVYMDFDYTALNRFGNAVYARMSPTNDLLEELSNRNVTILKLFRVLRQMEHYRAMLILKPYVDSRYHYWIREEDTNGYPSFDYEEKKAIAKASNPTNGRNLKTSERTRNGTERTTERKLSEGSDNDKLERCIRFIPYEEVVMITNSWDRTKLLGSGGFGCVYRGTWKQTEVAIKRPELQKANQGSKNLPEVQILQSLKELVHLNNSRHDNILPLYAYSLEDEKYILIYQFMPNGSLEDRLHRKNNMPLSWHHRYNIAKGTARGLQFLHEMDERPLVHGDIKCANILLDEHLEPKIADFGLAREGPLREHSHVKVSRVHGTRPYLPREFLVERKLSPKVDTYSFGVVLCELATGQKPYKEERSTRLLRDLVYCYRPELLRELMDPRPGLEDRCSEFIFTTLIFLAKKCVQGEPHSRPNMVDVFRELDENSSRITNIQRTMNNPFLNPSGRSISPYQVQSQNPPTYRTNQHPFLEVMPGPPLSHKPTVEPPNLSVVPDIVLKPPSEDVENQITTDSEATSSDSSFSDDSPEDEPSVAEAEQRFQSVDLGGNEISSGIPNISLLHQ